jgi:hypothetical protein
MCDSNYDQYNKDREEQRFQDEIDEIDERTGCGRYDWVDDNDGYPDDDCDSECDQEGEKTKDNFCDKHDTWKTELGVHCPDCVGEKERWAAFKKKRTERRKEEQVLIEEVRMYSLSMVASFLRNSQVTNGLTDALVPSLTEYEESKVIALISIDFNLMREILIDRFGNDSGSGQVSLRIISVVIKHVQDERDKVRLKKENQRAKSRRRRARAKARANSNSNSNSFSSTLGGCGTETGAETEAETELSQEARHIEEAELERVRFEKKHAKSRARQVRKFAALDHAIFLQDIGEISSSSFISSSSHSSNW